MKKIQRKWQLALLKNNNLFAVTRVFPRNDSFESEIVNSIIKEISKVQYEENKKLNTKLDDILNYVNIWAHEIKKPLQNLELLNDNWQSQLQIDQTKKFVENVLYVTKSENVNSNLELKAVNLQELVNEALKDFSFQLIDRNISIELHVPTTLILVDKYWLKYTLLQFIDNSIKYGATSIAFSYSAGTLKILDNGVGIHEYELAKVLEKSYVASNVKNQYSTGFGLYISNNILQKMNLNLNISSTVGRWTCIEISNIMEKESTTA
ncbi:MAG: sensor histidine kinase [Mycoplasmatales bacterium]